jgi:D-beta-D-heptose 7-phosphate kinase/D-beta-D-heptose 1-phosphate adenosyltransferase
VHIERKDAESLFNRAKNVKALVLGDLMLDEYLWGKAERISPEAPVQVVELLREDLRLGGTGNVANNLVAMGCSVAVCSVIGSDENGKILRRAIRGKGIDVAGVFEDPMRITSKKTRVLAANQQIVRIDRETRESISADYEEKILNFLQEQAGGWGVIVVSDYLKGVLTPRVLAAVIETGKHCGIPVVVDPKGDDYSKYKGATIITPNKKETEIATRRHIVDEESLNDAASFLLDAGEHAGVLITRSSEGMTLYLWDGTISHITTFAREVYDVTGAGDTVVAALGLGLACGMNFAEAAMLANVAAGIAVGKIGTSTVSPDEIIGAISHKHIDSEVKIKNLDVLAAIIEAEKGRGKQVVFTNGCFDLLHAGHVKYLQKARKFGDLLILGLNSDDSIRRLKGHKRPLIGQMERAHILTALDCIDYVVIFDEDTPIRLIEALRPLVLVKGGDYTADAVVGKDLVESYGGRVELVDFVGGKSTTNIIEKILQSYGSP